MGINVVWADPLPVAIDPTRVELEATPGEHLDSSVGFWNGTKGDLLIHVEPTDVNQSDEEGHAALEGEDVANSVKSRLKPEYPDLGVAPMQEITLNFSVDVPATADPGSHWGALLISTAPVKQSDGNAVEVKIGPIVLVKVLGDAKEHLVVENYFVPHFLETPVIPVEALFRNEGTVHEAPDGEVEVRNMFGALVATGSLPVRNVLPGTVRRIDAQVDGEGFWFGRYKVSLNANYGSNAATLQSSALVWIVPWKEYGWKLFVGVVLIALAVVARRRLWAFWHVLKTGAPPTQY